MKEYITYCKEINNSKQNEVDYKLVTEAFVEVFNKETGYSLELDFIIQKLNAFSTLSHLFCESIRKILDKLINDNPSFLHKAHHSEKGELVVLDVPRKENLVNMIIHSKTKCI